MYVWHVHEDASLFAVESMRSIDETMRSIDAFDR